MTAPRQVLPNTAYLVTRRCMQRQFLLRPSGLTNAIFKYVLAVAARRFGIRVHAFCVLSNHFHLVVTDTQARLPAFGQYLDSLVARAVNASLGRWESFWAPASYSAVVLRTPADIIAKAAYVLANPVAAGLVRRGGEWPGARSSPDHVGDVTVVTKPEGFFRASGSMPESAKLELTPPLGCTAAEFRAWLGEELERQEEQARSRVLAAGRAFLGAARALAQNPFARPSSFEPRRKLAPRAAGRDRWKRLEVLSRLASFVAHYREAWAARRRGRLDAVFPAGTYLLRVVHGVPCAGCSG